MVMKKKPAFNFEAAVALWRSTLKHQRFLETDHLDELEQHIRDQVAHLEQQGYGKEEAFEKALMAMGDKQETVAAYREAYWSRMNRIQNVRNEWQWRVAMAKNYLTTAFRSIRKDKYYAMINVLGLAIGFAGFILISLFVSTEFRYDRFHEKADRIYRVYQSDPEEHMGSNKWAVTPGPLVNALIEEFPEVEHAAQIEPVEMLLEQNNNRFFENGIYATPQFFDVFSFNLSRGTLEGVLDDPNVIVLTQILAAKYFGTANPIGQSVQVILRDDGSPREVELTVVGVVEDPPAFSHFSFDYIVSMATQQYYVEYLYHWDNNNYRTYAVLRPGSDLGSFEEKLGVLASTRLGEFDYYKKYPERLSTYRAQAMTDIHLRSRMNGELGANGDMTYVLLFSAIAILILFIACINYINLSVARAGNRRREVGVRKAMGAFREQLVVQFLGESVIPTVFALLIAIGLVMGLLPVFNELTARDITLFTVENMILLGILLFVGLGVGVLSGSFPAFVLSGFNPVGMMKGTSVTKGGMHRLRNSLVVAQFSITLVLIISTLVIHKQLRYIQNANTGVDRTQTVSIENKDPDLFKRYGVLKQQLLQHSSVQAVTTSQDPPTLINSSSGAHAWEGSQDGDRISVYYSTVQPGFIDQFDIELVEGRAFADSITTDFTEAIIINETLRDELGWGTAVGKWFKYRGREGRVIGVMKDFNFLSFRREINPLALYLEPDNQYTYSHILVKIGTHQVEETLAHIEHTLAEVSPKYPSEYQFLDDVYNNMYREEIRLGKLFNYFTFLALFVAGLGLLGMATFSVSQRTKEIGVRKVLGASITDILILLSRDYVRLIGIAFIVAAPLGYIALKRWLEEFAFSINVGVDTFLLAGSLAFLVALIAVAYQSLKAALANPVKSLKHE